jgi:hypothetical protein
MCNTENTKVEAIRSAIDMDSNNFTVYRKRLLKKGLIRDIEYGHLTFALPRFKEFIQRQIF